MASPQSIVTRPGIEATLILTMLAGALATGRAETTGNSTGTTLWYRQPAKLWASEALPIGNGRLGAMLFGGIMTERIQFNENTLWGGVNNWDGGFDTGDLGFGGYRTFGDIIIDWGEETGGPEVTSPSGHTAGNGQGIGNTADGNPATKWCIENPGKSVVWQVDLPRPQVVASYSLTSAPDVPSRDPMDWKLEATMDGKDWTTLDIQARQQPFGGRGQKQEIQIAKPGAFSNYRITFTPPAGASHFQVADIAMAGIAMASGTAAAAESVPADYRRSLDIVTGIHHISFTTPQGIKVTKESFASRPDQVMVFRFAADRKGALTGRIRLKPGQAGAVVTTAGNALAFAGTMPNKLRYACGIRIVHEGGNVAPTGNALAFDKCDAITILLDARTDYKPSFADGWRGEDPAPQVGKNLDRVATKPPGQLRDAHVADLSTLLGGTVLRLGSSRPEQRALPTDERIKRHVDEGKFRSGGDDPELEVLLFQMGRYLLASSSRPGGLPANLQGLWNDSNNPAWASDYHTNINLQMNYWPAETTGLGECATPLVDFIVVQAPACRAATKRAFGEKTRGWTARTSQSPFGGNAWEWNIPSGAWYALHVFDHWDFGRDENYLRATAYPILKEICEYWEDNLKKLPDGTLVAPNGWSPEHGPREDGVMHDQQIIRELFDDYLKAAKALQIDAAYQSRVADMQARLAPNKIGKWSQLQEWQTDRDDPNNRHRHTSHLFALFPGRQINRTTTPELADAARVSLLARSNDTSGKSGVPWTPAQMHPESIYGWVWPWRAAMWARLGDGDRAHTLLWGKMGNSAPNMLGLNVPYFSNHQELIQLDNSFGATAAIAEMLVQSHAGEIDLLPALPKQWAKDGSFTGLRARGGYTVDCAWKDGKVTRHRITARHKMPVNVRINGEMKTLTPEHLP